LFSARIRSALKRSASRSEADITERNLGRSIGGIEGDYEFIELSRHDLEKIPLSLMEIFKIFCQCGRLFPQSG
jgi:hypothetical protein